MKRTMQSAGMTAIGLIAALGLGAPAHAQGLEEILVTAQKRTENLQDVPIQVTAFTAQTIEDAGIGTTQDFVDLVPNMSLDDSYTYLNTFVVVRGVTQINNADAPVAIVIDGVPQNNQKQFKMNLFDIERIEVLKGPQGALYGRNAIGGAVNIVTKQPSNELEGFAEASYGNGDAWEITGGVSGPIVEDKVMFRVAGYYKEDNGRITNTTLNRKVDTIDHDYGMRARLTVVASENVNLDFRASYQDFRAGGLYDTSLPDDSANTFLPPYSNIMGETWGDILELTFKADVELPFATLTAITGYTDLTENNRGDLDFTNQGVPFLFDLGVGQGQDLDVKLLSQELRLVSPDDQRFRWIVGAYYIRTDRQLLTRAFIDLTGSTAQIDDPFLVISEDNNNDAYALFGQFDYDIVDGLVLSGALRYDEDKRHQDDLVNDLTRKHTFDSLQPKVTLTWNIDDDRLVYGSYSKGFRSGGFNNTGTMFEDETLDNYEAGFKTSWLDRRLILNGAVYYSEVKDFQFFYVDVATASQVISNIDKVNIWGIELEAQALLTEGLQVFGAVGTTDSDIKRISLFPGNEGNKTPKTTSWKLNAGFQFRQPIADDLSLFLRMDYEHRGKKYWQIDNRDVQGPLDLINARVGVEGESWGLYLWGKNLTDEKYYADYNPREFSGHLLGLDLGFLAQPRTYGIEGRVRF